MVRRRPRRRPRRRAKKGERIQTAWPDPGHGPFLIERFRRLEPKKGLTRREMETKLARHFLEDPEIVGKYLSRTSRHFPKPIAGIEFIARHLLTNAIKILRTKPVKGIPNSEVIDLNLFSSDRAMNAKLDSLREILKDFDVKRAKEIEKQLERNSNLTAVNIPALSEADLKKLYYKSNNKPIAVTEISRIIKSFAKGLGNGSIEKGIGIISESCEKTRHEKAKWLKKAFELKRERMACLDECTAALVLALEKYLILPNRKIFLEEMKSMSEQEIDAKNALVQKALKGDIKWIDEKVEGRVKEFEQAIERRGNELDEKTKQDVHSATHYLKTLRSIITAGSAHIQLASQDCINCMRDITVSELFERIAKSE